MGREYLLGAMGEKLDKLKESCSKLPPALTILKVTGIVTGVVLFICGLWLFIASWIPAPSITNIIIGFYLVIGGVMMVLGELQFKWYISRVSFLGSHAGRGIFYLFVGSLCYVVSGIDGLVFVVLIIVGILVMALGVFQVVFHFLGHKFGNNSSSSNQPGSGYTVEYGQSSSNAYGRDTELQDPNFDPNFYSDFTGQPQPASLEKQGLNVPDYEAL